MDEETESLTPVSGNAINNLKSDPLEVQHPKFENSKLGLKSLPVHEPQHDKTNKATVRPAKTQISLCIRPV